MQCLSQFVTAERMYLSLTFLEQKRFHPIGRSKEVQERCSEFALALSVLVWWFVCVLFFVVDWLLLFVCSFVVVFGGVHAVKVCLFILVVVFLLAFVPIQSDGQLCPQVWKISRIFHCCLAGRGGGGGGHISCFVTTVHLFCSVSEFLVVCVSRGGGGGRDVI